MVYVFKRFSVTLVLCPYVLSGRKSAQQFLYPPDILERTTDSVTFS
jgi:hypothetical protein